MALSPKSRLKILCIPKEAIDTFLRGDYISFLRQPPLPLIPGLPKNRKAADKLFLLLPAFINILFLTGLIVLLGSCRTAGGSGASATASAAPAVVINKCGFPVFGNYYRNLKNWIPNDSISSATPPLPHPLNHAPLKEVALNFNIFQDSQGAGNFQDTPEDRAFLINWIKQLNEIFGNVAAPTDPIPDMPVTLPGNDTRFRFSIGPQGQERIYFYQDDALHRNSSQEMLFNKVKQTDSSRTRQLNVFFTQGFYQGKIMEIKIEDGGSGYKTPPVVSFNPPGANATAVISDAGKVTGIEIKYPGYYFVPEVSVTISGGGGSDARATATIGRGADGFLNSMPDYLAPNGDAHITLLRQKSGGYTSVYLLAHELGHAFGLEHTFGGYHCVPDHFLKDVYGGSGGSTGNCPHENLGWQVDPGLHPDDRVTNNLMTYAPDAPKYLSPMQAGIMHRATAVTMAKKYVGEAYSPVPFTITKEESWDFNMRLYQDIIVDKGGSLALKCNLTMPLQARIIVKEGGKLVLDGGKVQPFTPQQWQGIEVNEGGVAELRSTDVANYLIQVKKGGTLLVPDSAYVALQQNGKIAVERGGYISISNSARLTLQDEHSAIDLQKGSRFGVNTAVMPKPADYVTAARKISFKGKGIVNRGSRSIRNKVPLQEVP